jgi:hypothetical protein
VTGFHENGNEPADSVNVGEFLSQHSDCQFHNKDSAPFSSLIS